MSRLFSLFALTLAVLFSLGCSAAPPARREVPPISESGTIKITDDADRQISVIVDAGSVRQVVGECLHEVTVSSPRGMVRLPGSGGTVTFLVPNLNDLTRLRPPSSFIIAGGGPDNAIIFERRVDLLAAGRKSELTVGEFEEYLTGNWKNACGAN